MSNFRPVDRRTGFLLPPSVDEWLPERHLARYVVEVATVRAPEADPRPGVRHHQVGDGFPSVLAPRSRPGQGRVELGDLGLECEANVRPDPRLKGKWAISTSRNLGSMP